MSESNRNSESEIQKSSQSTSGQSPQQLKNAKKRKIIDHKKDGQTWTRLTGAPAWELPPNDQNQTFTGRCRLFVANLPQNITEDQLRSLFGEFGQISDIYIGKGNQFAFVKMDTRINAETAKQHLDGKLLENRTLRVRLAAHAAAIRVTGLPPLVSNELLHLAFSSFGTVERAVVSADDRGRSLNEGIVEFARKSSSQAAIKKCQNECLLLSSTAIPVVVTPLESRDEEEGVPEKSIVHAPEYRTERELGPRFAEQGTIEWEMARKWKQLSQIEAQRRESSEQEFRDLRENLRQQMEYIKIEETTKQLREQLRQMENQSQKLCHEREQRIEAERRREEQRRHTEIVLRQQEEQLLRRNSENQDLGQLRRQENELRQQANALQQLLDRQEAALRQMGAQDVIQPQLDINGHSLYNSQIPSLQTAQTQSQYLSPNIQMRSQAPPTQHQTPPNYRQNQQMAGMGGAMGGAIHHNYKRNRRF